MVDGRKSTELERLSRLVPEHRGLRRDPRFSDDLPVDGPDPALAPDAGAATGAERAEHADDAAHSGPATGKGLGRVVSDAAGQGATADQSHSFAQVSPKP